VDELIDALHRSGSNYTVPDSSYGYGIPDMLKTYNILKNKDADTSVIRVFLPSHTATDSIFTFYVQVKSRSFLCIEGSMEETKPIILRTYIQRHIKKCKPGLYCVEMKTPVLESEEDWKLMNLRFYTQAAKKTKVKKYGKKYGKKFPDCDPQSACAAYVIGIEKVPPLFRQETTAPVCDKQITLNFSKLSLPTEVRGDRLP
jgi:hypothetical protein